ncbi:hypothetical protein CH63R_08367 [Colletotrichum higginsianum IMI 349063]|uniref:Tat pathway signal sequence n=1 Tax=Colletotrichum higginsianum (strain IMI 349063) TaxID=759273 RepID=A0A1B7YBZ8_COLHI|nr:hypothetical protein CH63R_08367 [Colletotrichum higginsianum IMI 349063]OBR09602.1 hypothetical protein CH63R_08367 [Colletotrichum higginsianum IMI 349063]GJC96325.1 hypothetical protein ColKHC_05151 [Colletotrichum higginsianum]
MSSVESMPKLSHSMEAAEETTRLLNQIHEQAAWRRERRRLRWAAWLWFTITLLFAGLSALLTARRPDLNHFGSFDTGYATDLKAAAKHIELEVTTFEGTPGFMDDGTEYIPGREDGTQRLKYTGTPSREIDINWYNLHLGEGHFFIVTEDEAREAWGPEYVKYWEPRAGGYVATYDHIRKAFHPEAYHDPNPVHGILHRDHCIESLLQLLVCTADLTPIPSMYRLGLGTNYINTDRPHTCRNFPKIVDFVKNRFNGTSRVEPYAEAGWKNQP